MGTSPSQTAGLHPEPCHHLLQDGTIWVMSPLSPTRQADWYTILQCPLQKASVSRLGLDQVARLYSTAFQAVKMGGILPAVTQF